VPLDNSSQRAFEVPSQARHRLRPVSEIGHAERAEDPLAEPGLASVWRRLAEARSNPFITPEWYESSLEAYPGERPFAIVWRRDGEVGGVLPLVAVSRGPFKVLRFAGARRADWLSPACRRDDEEAMGAAVAALLKRERGRWQALRFDRVEAESDWPRDLLRGEGGDLALAPRRRQDVLPYIEFDERGYEGYLADRSRNFRSQLGRRRRKLERDHQLRFRMTETPAELEADLDGFFELHDERWRRRGGSSSQDPAARAHLRLFAAAALQRGWLRLWTAEADGAPAAAWYGWRIGERYCYALAGLRESFEPLALGTVLLAHTIEQAAAEGAPIYDLMWGDEGYKTRFETGRREAATWILSRRRHPARAAICLGVRSRRALEGLPAGVKQPLGRVGRAVRRT
jgi:CelD/BcsL family acetyltransferase involved in cellulose biosynthesis